MRWISSAKLFVGISALTVGLVGANEIPVDPADHRTLLDPEFERFVRQKRALEEQLAKKHAVAVPEIVRTFFDASQTGDWQRTTNQFYAIEAGTGRSGGKGWMPLTLWGPVHDTLGAYEQFHSWNPKLLHGFGDKIITMIPTGSIYFGGTDAGRFIISALTASHSEGRPFFTLTQNALADPSYVDYLRDMYGTNIYLPTIDDSQRVFQEYITDAQKRLEKNQLRDGESIQVVKGRVQVNGVVAVMALNELLVKLVINKNPSREIFLEESYALEGLYGQSSPHGLIFKVHHQPLKQLPSAVLEADHRFWTDECRVLVGNAVRVGTTVAELCSWTEKTFLHPESDAFEGTRAYAKDRQAPQYFSQCRSAIAAYYNWWSKKTDASESIRLAKEADFAHRQAIALSPYNPTTVWRYASFLLQNQRTNDAKVLVETTLRIDPEKQMTIDSDQLKTSLLQLRSAAAKLK
jgi:hypothetical protein